MDIFSVPIVIYWGVFHFLRPLKFYAHPIKFTYPIELITLGGIGSIIGVLIASIVPVRKITQKSIIDSLKYE